MAEGRKSGGYTTLIFPPPKSNLGKVVCETGSDFEIICSLLSLPSLQSWTIKSINLGKSGLWQRHVHKIQEMKFEKGKVSQVTIGCWTEKGDCNLSLSPLVDCLHSHGVEEIKIKEVYCTSHRTGVGGAAKKGPIPFKMAPMVGVAATSASLDV